MSDTLLHGYQQRWLADQARFKAAMFARQTGKTFTSTLELAQDCQIAQAEGRRARWVILSRGERQAKEAIEEGVKMHCRAIGAVVRAADADWKGQDSIHKALEVVWPNGSRVTALPANPDTARGFSANVLLDEFAFHADSRKIWAALFPVISAGHKLRVVSTPNGKGNKFYEIMTGSDPIWSRHQVDIYQAVADGLPRDIEQLRTALNDPDAWAQEFELHWLDEASAWLPYDLISSVEHDQAGDPERYQGHPCYVGVDIGRRKDLFVIWVWEQVGDVAWCRDVIARNRITFAAQDQLLDDVMRRYKVARVAMDQTGMGEKPLEDAQRRYGSSRVEGVLFSASRKQAMATLGKARFEDRQVRIPMGDSAIRADLHSLRRVSTATGGVRFDVSSEGDGHGDRAWAAFLGLAAADQGASPIEYQTGPSPHRTSELAYLTGSQA